MNIPKPAAIPAFKWLFPNMIAIINITNITKPTYIHISPVSLNFSPPIIINYSS